MSEPDFTQLNMKIPTSIKTYPVEKQREIYEYLSGLDEINRKGYDIAFDHLGTSFNIVRSNGFKQWLAEKSSN
jgi:hypothetical protein